MILYSLYKNSLHKKLFLKNDHANNILPVRFGKIDLEQSQNDAVQ